MKKYFNIAGPCITDEHYMILSESRCGGINDLIEQKQYFVIHAARQSGKTTLLLDIVRKLNEDGKYHALYCSLRCAQGADDREKGMLKIVEEFGSVSGFGNEPQDYPDLRSILIKYCKKIEKQVVIFFDDTECLSDDVLTLFLRQIRSQFAQRYMIPFPSTICFAVAGKLPSWFNIIAATLKLSYFSEAEVSALYGQHTKETGQIFPPEVIRSVYHHSQGQPWLVNAVAREIVTEILGSDHSESVTPEHVGQAVETIIRRRDTHIDSLLERLKEDRVRKIVEPVLTGEEKGFDFTDDDYQYVLDLGLIRNIKGVLQPSNPIYAEVIIRKLSSESQMSMDSADFPPEAPAYLESGMLNMKKLLTDFQQFWRENSAIWEERFFYKEAAPHLILMAFLQRIINSGGRIDRELATGRKRIDLCICYQDRRYPIEIKIRRSAKTYDEGKKQLSDYMDTLGCDKGWLVVFDKRKKQSWKSRLFWKTGKADKKEIHIVGC